MVPRNPCMPDTYPVRYDSQSVISRSRPALTPSTGSQSGSATPGTRVQRLRAEDRAGTPRSFTTHQHANGHTSRQAQCIHVHGKQVCSVLSSFVSNIRVTRDGAARAACAVPAGARGRRLARRRARENRILVFATLTRYSILINRCAHHARPTCANMLATVSSHGWPWRQTRHGGSSWGLQHGTRGGR